MAKLHFFYSTMNAGKSTALLQTNNNFIENNLETLVFIPSIVNQNKVISRIGIQIEAIPVDTKFDLYEYVESKKNLNIKSVFVDEAQFLKKQQIEQLSLVADFLNIPVMCYGLRTDFKGDLFEGSKSLLSIADNLHEIKTICSMCTKKATMVIKVNSNGEIETDGEIIKIGGNDIYKSVCRKHFRKLTKLI